jgi:ABC-type Zn uptake system ZnuABC Zn-binding protein ZnuA
MPARIAAVLLALVTLAGCGEDDGGAAGSDRLTVVATTTQAADLARVGGADVEVVGLLAPNADPHEYEVRPRDLQALTDADLIVRSGGDLDEWLADAIEGSGSEAPVVTLIDKVHTIEGEHGHEEEEHAGEEEEEHEIDPHWWQDPRNAIVAVAEIERGLAAADAAHADAYAANADRYEARLRKLDRAVAACIDKVPAAQRKLVTTHDALGYYAERYGIEVIGAVIPSLSTSGQPSAGETAELVETIRDEHVKAIFAESSVNAKVEQAIARESGATVGKALWADTLGPAGSEGETYIGSIVSNTRALVDGFTGGEVTCSIDV